MTNCIFYTLFFTLFLNVSIGSLKYSQVHRTYKAAYKGMYEACTVSIDKNGEPIVPYYNTTKMTNYLKNYFNENLTRYVKDYTLEVRYLAHGTSTLFLCRTNCRRVRVKLTAKINSFYSYSNNEIFVIKDGDTL